MDFIKNCHTCLLLSNSSLSLDVSQKVYATSLEHGMLKLSPIWIYTHNKEITEKYTLTGLMEAVHIELSNERGEIAVLEVLWQHNLRELFDLER